MGDRLRVGILHYSGPPTVGGVEQTIFYHSTCLSDLGHSPLVIVGKGAPFDERVEHRLIPEIFSGNAEVLAVKSELDEGRISDKFTRLTARVREALENVLPGLEALVVHNVLTLHKNLALTAALAELNQAGTLPRFIGWHHDFAWDRPGYASDLHTGAPWDLLRHPWPGVTNVVVSKAQQEKLALRYGLALEQIRVVSPGFDPWMGTTDLARRIITEFGLREAEALLLLPARITRRKNIEYAIHVLAALRRLSGRDFRLLITGPPGQHNPKNVAYSQELQALQKELDLTDSLHFLYRSGEELSQGVDPRALHDLYSLCDALLFPSVAEGFGIPVLEAAASRMPVFCSDIPPFRESAGELATYFQLSDPPERVAQRILDLLFADRAFLLWSRLRRRHAWPRIVREEVIRILEDG
ncbi:MAG: glycosyltransferase family 4 protein [Anaerolineales bacterium]